MKKKTEEKLRYYVGKAIADFNMIQSGDKIMVCLSGGKDSFGLLMILNQLRKRAPKRFSLHAFTLDQGQPGWDDTALRAYLDKAEIPYTIYREDTYKIVTEKLDATQTYCSLCSRLRRGIIYRFAEKHGFTKIALGHHRDDLITSLLMSILYNGSISTMPPKLLTDNKRHILIRPLAYCQENDLINYATEMQFPIIPCNLCGSQKNLKRNATKQLIQNLAKGNPKIPSNILHAIGNIHPSQLMDKSLWDFKTLETQRIFEGEEIHEDALF